MKKFSKETFLLLSLIFFSAYQGIVILVISEGLGDIYIAVFIYAMAALFIVLALSAKPKERKPIALIYEEPTTNPGQEIQTR